MNLGKIKPLGWVLIVGGIIAVICGFTVFGGLGNLFGGRDDIAGGSGQAGNLGQMYTALEVDSNGCPIQPADEFFSDETIYVGLDESDIPAGTEMFMRLYYDGEPVEDTDPIQADQALNTCVWFEFQPRGSGGFEPGNYEAELVVNGNVADTINFDVSNDRAGGALPGTGSGNIQPGRMYASTNVDSRGCPIDDVSKFFSDEVIYVSLDESFVPQGTEMFARLVYEGQILEDTEPIVADQDIESCIWFSFEGNRSDGFSLGRYQAEIYANGSLVDSIQFDVQ